MTVLRKAIVITLAVFCVGSVFFLGWLDDHYYWTRPRQSDPASGRVIAKNVKTTGDAARVYLTRRETLPYDLFPYLFPILALSAALLDQRWKVFRNPREDMPKKLY
jgi:hypothetical protein